MANPAGASRGEVLRLESARRRIVQFRGPGVTADAGLLAFRPDIEILPLFADRRMDLLAEGDAVELVEHGLAIPLDDTSDLRAPGLDADEASHRFRQAKHGGMAGGGRVDVLVSEGEFAFVAAVGAALFGAAIGENTLR